MGHQRDRHRPMKARQLPVDACPVTLVVAPILESTLQRALYRLLERTHERASVRQGHSGTEQGRQGRVYLPWRIICQTERQVIESG